MTTPPTTPNPAIDVIIVNYRTADLTIDCLRSLAPELPSLRGGRVHVVDNASNDGSLDRLRSAVASNPDWHSWITLIDAGQNGGFAAGNNAALHPILTSPTPPAYILLLNPDTVVRPGAIAALVNFMDRHPAVGIAGSRLEHPDGQPQISSFRFPTLLSELESALRLRPVTRLLSRWTVPQPIPTSATQTDWVAGASMIIRRDVFDSIGPLDAAYFMYYEEVDFCLQARRAGWPCWYVPDSRVVHLVGQSSGLNSASQKPKRLPPYWFESRRRYFTKNHGTLYATLTDLTWTLAHATWRLRRPLQRKPDTDPPHLLTDFLRHSPLLHPLRAKATRPKLSAHPHHPPLNPTPI